MLVLLQLLLLVVLLLLLLDEASPLRGRLCSDELQLAESSAGQKSGHSSSEASRARFKSFSSSLLGFLVCRYLKTCALVARRLGLEPDWTADACWRPI